MIAIIGATTLIILPAISALTEHAEKTSAKHYAQMLASVASAAQATSEPIFRNLKSKPALLSYLCSGSSLEDGSGVARVSLAGLSQDDHSKHHIT
ncbi:MAG: hypothetical protein P1U82_09625 [Verrucomicrobiales bacterium]|nr:hypothetical protein [Verrucomicrobiales bacterium]